MVYLLHFDKPYKHARHYLGYTRRLEQRLEYHRRGHGARLMAAATSAGVTFVVARTWPKADRTFERQLHNRKNNPQLCPVCTPPA